MFISALDSIYSDDLISATELNRQPGRILDMALEHPVTITRNDHAFALLRREKMAELVKAAAQTKFVVEIINVVYQLSQGKEIGSDHSYRWLKVFDGDELSELVADVISAFHLGYETGDWDTLDTVIYEWHESALAINSSELKEAFSDELDEVLLTPPTVKSLTGH